MRSAEQIIALENQYESGALPHMPVVLERGLGAKVWDVNGKEYIDCLSGHGVANVGHSHPAVVKAIQEQAAKMITCGTDCYNPVRAELLEKLVHVATPGIERAFLCNSGAEAVEGCLKIARMKTGRPKIIAAMRAFHGRTFGALSATHRKEYREPFEPLVPGFEHVPYNRLERMAAALDDTTAAVILEVVQGEGGVNIGDGDYLRGVQQLCRERGALFIIDEVQTGFGRTGKMWACEHYGLEPDLVASAKGIAGGVPMGAVLIGARIGAIEARSHGTTFGGNPLACAAALATIGAIESEGIVENAAARGVQLMQGLRQIESSQIREVRGLGLLVGMEMKGPVGGYLARLAERGIIALTAGSTIMRFLPPLVITEDEVNTVLENVTAVLEAEGG